MYQWLMSTHPYGIAEANNWKRIAESVLIYCNHPMYSQLNSTHEKKILQKANELHIPLEHHLPLFNKKIQDIEDEYRDQIFPKR